MILHRRVIVLIAWVCSHNVEMPTFTGTHTMMRRRSAEARLSRKVLVIVIMFS